MPRNTRKIFVRSKTLGYTSIPVFDSDAQRRHHGQPRHRVIKLCLHHPYRKLASEYVTWDYATRGETRKPRQYRSKSGLGLDLRESFGAWGISGYLKFSWAVGEIVTLKAAPSGIGAPSLL